MRLLQEPNAAAIASKYQKSEDEQRVLVFDFGGGTLDVTLLLIEDGQIEVEEEHGNSLCGGRDIDQILVDFCVKQFEQEFNLLVPHKMPKMNLLRLQCERSKTELQKEEVTVTRVKLRGFYNDKNLDVKISRD